MLLSAGCGGGSTASHALAIDPVAAAATKTQNAGAARVRFALTFSNRPGAGHALRMRGVGAIDGTSSELSFSLGSILGRLGLPSSATSKLGPTSMRAVTLEEKGDYVLYVHLGFLSSQLPGRKQWIKLDLSKLGKSAGLDLGKLLSGSRFGPADLLSLLKGEGATVRKLGPATVAGAATTHYRVTVDLAEALRSKGLTSPLLAGAAARSKTVSEDVWIGTNGLVRRVQSSYGFGGEGTRGHVSMTMDIYDYGARVTIAAPPSSQVFEGTQLAEQGVGSSLP